MRGARRGDRGRSERPAVEVYDGLAYAGAIVDAAPGRYEAFGADARLIGSFPNSQAATDAVLAAWRGGAGDG